MSERLVFDILARDMASRAFREVAREAERTARAVRESNAKTELSMRGLDSRLRGISPIAAFAPAGIAALAPVLGVATAAAAGLGAALSSAALGAGSFALVAVPAFKTVTDASTKLAAAQLRVTNATTSKQRATALHNEAQLWKALTPPQQAAVNGLRAFETTWKKFQAGFQPKVFGIFAQGLTLASSALNGLKPLVAGTLPYVSALLDVVKRSGPFWSQWAVSMSRFAGPALSLMGQAILNVAKGIGSLIVAFAPLGMSISTALVGMSAKFAAWAANFGPSGQLGQFMAYVRANGPAVRDLFLQLGTALHTLGAALLTAGPGFLGAAVNLLKLFNALTAGHPALATFLIEGASVALLAGKIAGAFKAFTVLSGLPGIIGGVSGAIKTLGFNMQVAAATGIGGRGGAGLLGGLGKMTSFLGGPWALAVGAAATLIGGAFLKQQHDAKTRVDDLTGSLDKQTGALTNLSNAIIAKQLQDAGAFKAAKILGISVRDVTLAAEGNAPAMARVNAELTKTRNGGRAVQGAVATLTHALDIQNGTLAKSQAANAKAKAKADELAIAMGKSVGPTHSATTATGGASDAASGAALAYQRFHDKVDALKGLTVNIPITTSGEAAAERALGRLANAVQAANLRGVNIQVTAGSHTQARAAGGPVWPGQDFLVGEHGPEYGRFAANATIFPHGTRPPGGGITVEKGAVQVTLSVAADVDAAKFQRIATQAIDGAFGRLQQQLVRGAR